jgi:hypothetical protein
MVPPIARNTIILTGSLAIGCIVDFINMMNRYKKIKPK